MMVLMNLALFVKGFAAAVVTFVVVFLAIFISCLIYDMKTAPHDGQGGMGGFLLGLPIAAITAFFVWAYVYDSERRQRLKARGTATDSTPPKQ